MSVDASSRACLADRFSVMIGVIAARARQLPLTRLLGDAR